MTRYFYKRIILCIISLSLSAHLIAQSCGTDEYWSAQVKNNPARLKTQQEMESVVAAQTAAWVGGIPLDTTTVIIPVVFHIIHKGGSENLSDVVIKAQMNTLNLTWNKQNRDSIYIRPLYGQLLANCHVKFQLATRDPYGNCTTGIEHIRSPLTDSAGDNIKALSWWDNTRYLNIWIVKSIAQNTGIKGIVAGYSKFPWDAVNDPSLDGIVLTASFVGANQKTLTHEMGHFFGLYHPFQDGCGTGNPYLEGDHVADTPPVATANLGGCNTNTNSCSTDNPDLPDMVENYMDYADCKYLFTKGQVARMRMYLFSSARASLFSATNLAYTLGECQSSIAGITQKPLTVNIYPNPVTDDVHISMVSPISERAAIEVTDITGKTLFTIPSILLKAGEQQINFLKEELNIRRQGVYFILISTDSYTSLQKVCVQ